MFETLKQRIEALSEPERSARRGLYSDWEWENSWELLAFPHQLAPTDSAWSSWSIIGPPRTGATTAGQRWALEKLLEAPKNTTLSVFHHTASLSLVGRTIRSYLTDLRMDPGFTFKERTSHSGSIHNMSTGSVLILAPANRMLDFGRDNPDFVWADEISDASEVMMTFPLVKQFVFTRPVKLPKDTRVSRAGDPRVV